MHDERTSTATAARRQQQQRRQQCVVVQSQIARLEAEIYGQFRHCIANEQRKYDVDIDEEVNHRLLVDGLTRLVELVVEWRCANERVANKQRELDEDGRRVALFWSFGRQISGHCAEQSQCEERIKLCEQLDRLLQLCFDCVDDNDSSNETETECTRQRAGLRGECAFRSCVTLVATSRGAETYGGRTLLTTDSRLSVAEYTDDDDTNTKSTNKCYFEFDDVDELDSWCFETERDETEEILNAAYWRAVSRFACSSGARTTRNDKGDAETGTLYRRRAADSSEISRTSESTLRIDADDEAYEARGSADLSSGVWSHRMSITAPLPFANGGASKQRTIDHQRAIQRFAQFCARPRSHYRSTTKTPVYWRHRARMLGRNTTASVAQSRRIGKKMYNNWLRKTLRSHAPL